MIDKKRKRKAEAAAKDKFERALLSRIDSVSLFEDSVWEELVAVLVTADGLARVFRSNAVSDDQVIFFEMREDRSAETVKVTVELPTTDD